MPPKSKGKKKTTKGKQSTVVDGLSTEEMSKDQLEEHIVRLREELDREREERSYFQLERDKIREFWDICQRNVEEVKAALRNAQREREEAEERHRVEITVYKQKLKHVLAEHHNIESELKIGGVTSISLIQNQHTESELGLRGQVHGLQADFRKKTLENENRIKEFKLKHQVELMELTNDFDKRTREIVVEHQKEIRCVLEADRKQHSAELLRLEAGYKSLIETVMKEQETAFQKAKLCCNTTEERMRSQDRERKVHSELRKDLWREQRKLSAAERENKHLRESQQEGEQKLVDLHKQLEEYSKARAEIMRSSARVKVMEKELRDLSVEHELLLQAFEKVQQERDQLLRKQTDAILDVQQRRGLKEMLLERKLAALTETLERKETQLCAALSSSNVDQTAASSAANKLQETSESKNVTITTLEQDLARDSQEHDQLLQMSKERLNALGVLPYDIPFRPSRQILGGQTRVQT